MRVFKGLLTSNWALGFPKYTTGFQSHALVFIIFSGSATLEWPIQAHRGSNRTQAFLLNTTATTSTASAGLIRRLEIASAKHGCQDGRSAGGPFWRAASHPVHRERYEMCSPAHRGRLIVAPLWPRAVQARLVRANAAKADYRFGAKSRPRWYRASCSDRQEETSGVLLIERAPDPETDDAVPTAGCSTATISRADLIFKAGPGTAAEAMVAAIAGHPWRSVDRCAPIILV